MSTDNSEEWRRIDGLEGYYSVSSIGFIRRNETGQIRKGQPGGWRGKYLQVRLSVNNRGVSLAIHDTVARAFLGPKPPGVVINHKDGDTHNNAAVNLEYVPSIVNERHAADNGLKAWGRRHGMVKLTEQQVREIRVATGSLRGIAAKYGTSNTNVLSIRHRRTWRHLP